MRDLRFVFIREVGGAEDGNKRIILARVVFLKEWRGCLKRGRDGIVGGGGESSQLEGCEGVWAGEVGVFYCVCCHCLFEVLTIVMVEFTS